MSSDTQSGISRRTLLAWALSCGAVAGRSGLARAALSVPSPTEAVVIEDFGPDGKSRGKQTVAKVVHADSEWRQQLSAAAYTVTRHEGTEPAFSGEYDHNHADGLYACVCCKTVLFDSRTKFDSGTGW
ncbi:MAG TPA: peptide-methionine (R)-S-oxide reductase, partial [Candidatus Dormibacteraeota bacterium]|nr:peptide-methionine (R)-S-oxide reductase [Candidatus Dormibacteraeota bacterium]